MVASFVFMIIALIYTDYEKKVSRKEVGNLQEYISKLLRLREIWKFIRNLKHVYSREVIKDDRQGSNEEHTSQDGRSKKVEEELQFNHPNNAQGENDAQTSSIQQI